MLCYFTLLFSMLTLGSPLTFALLEHRKRILLLHGQAGLVRAAKLLRAIALGSAWMTAISVLHEMWDIMLHSDSTEKKKLKAFIPLWTGHTMCPILAHVFTPGFQQLQSLSTACSGHCTSCERWARFLKVRKRPIPSAVVCEGGEQVAARWHKKTWQDES